MPHTTPNIPTSQPDNRKTSTINETMKAAKGNANTNFGAGIGANSTSSGTSATLDETVQERSFWAVLTRRLRFYSTPPLAWLRIPNDQKPRDKDGKYIRDPWESYDGYSYDSTPSNLVQTGVDEGGRPIYEEMGVPNGISTEGRFARYYPQGDTFNRGTWSNDIKSRKSNFVFPEQDPLSVNWNTKYAPNPMYDYPPETAYFNGFHTQSQLTYTDLSLVQEQEWYVGYCQQFFWCYGWCEIIEDLDFDRLGNAFYNAVYPRIPSALKGSQKTRTSKLDPIGLTVEQEGYGANLSINCYQNFIPEQHRSHGGLWGSAMGPFPAHEINNELAYSGEIVRMYKGKGEYYLFEASRAIEQFYPHASKVGTVQVGGKRPNYGQKTSPWTFDHRASTEFLDYFGYRT
jgi:hypothetical protein